MVDEKDLILQCYLHIELTMRMHPSPRDGPGSAPFLLFLLRLRPPSPNEDTQAQSLQRPKDRPDRTTASEPPEGPKEPVVSTRGGVSGDQGLKDADAVRDGHGGDEDDVEERREGRPDELEAQDVGKRSHGQLPPQDVEGRQSEEVQGVEQVRDLVGGVIPPEELAVPDDPGHLHR